MRNKMIKYSILIPTCRKDNLVTCLKYLSLINQPQKEYEVIVLHNATKDDVKSLTDSYHDSIPNLKYIFEDEVGTMASRHRGAKEAKGDILCYLDDDSFVDKNWLIGIEETFADKAVACACGPCLPLYESTPPHWLRYFWNPTPWGNYMAELSLVDFYNTTMKVPAWFSFGCNMPVRKDLFFSLKGTDPCCMPPDKVLYTGDGETAISIKLDDAGYPAIYNPKIKIHHYVPTSRMTIEYFIKRAQYEGYGASFMDYRMANNLAINCDFTHKAEVSSPDVFFEKKWKELIRKFYNSSLFAKDKKEYARIKKIYDDNRQYAYDLHQKSIKEDPLIKEWVSKKTYF